MKKLLFTALLGAMIFVGCDDNENQNYSQTAPKSNEGLNLSLFPLKENEVIEVLNNGEPLLEEYVIDCHSPLHGEQGTYLVTVGGKSYLGQWSRKPFTQRPGVHYFQKDGVYFSTEPNTSGVDCFDIWGVEHRTASEEPKIDFDFNEPIPIILVNGEPLIEAGGAVICHTDYTKRSGGAAILLDDGQVYWAMWSNDPSFFPKGLTVRQVTLNNGTTQYIAAMPILMSSVNSLCN